LHAPTTLYADVDLGIDDYQRKESVDAVRNQNIYGGPDVEFTRIKGALAVSSKWIAHNLRKSLLTDYFRPITLNAGMVL
jgi:hypothetical protein